MLIAIGLNPVCQFDIYQKSKLLLCFIFLLHEVLFLIYTFHFCYMFYYIVTSILFIFKFLLHITIFILFNFKFV